MTDPVFQKWAESGLVWLPERGMGFYPVTEAPYDGAYWQKYVEYANTEKGRAILGARLALTEKYMHCGTIVDVGIGCGAFVQARGPSTFGYDVSPVGIEWLHAAGKWLNPFETPAFGATFWDAIEHIRDIAHLLANIQRWIFITVPLFSDADHVLRSRHFRKDEHCWYWTRDGLIAWMLEHGFTCVEHNTMESLLGREDAHTFVFKRDEA